jgi:hypothetical protein
MKHFFRSWILTTLLGGVVWVGASGEALAQYMPFMGRGGFGGMPAFGYNPWAFSPAMGSAFLGSPYLASPYGMGYGSTYSYSTFNPYGAGVMSYQYSPYGGPNSYSFFNPYTGRAMSYSANVPYYMSGYGGGYGGYMPYSGSGGATTTGGYGSYGTSSNPITEQQLRILRGAAYQGSPAYGNDTKPYAARPEPATRAASATTSKPAELNTKLLSAPEADVLSGRALTSLGIEIRNLEGKGARAESPLFPAEIVSRASFDGPGAGLLQAARAGKPQFPTALQGKPFAELRGDIERAYTAMAGPVGQGKVIDAATADHFTAAVARAKAALVVRELPADDRAAAMRFLNGLDELAQAAKDPSLAGIYPAKWSKSGATAAELIRHLDKHKLTFAPAPAGSEEAYGALYRGLSGYYVSLAQGRK